MTAGAARRSVLVVLQVALCALAGCRSGPPAPRPAFDVILHGGTVIDGSGTPGRRADVGIRDGRITAVGELRPADAARQVDCTGRVVAPGFVDLHAHVDAEIARKPTADNFVQMGVTSLITGNCGTSVRDLGLHFGRCERGGLGLNYGSLIGHGTVRTQVMGTANRAPTPEELARMEALVEKAMQDGAFGMSTGLIYVPGIYSETAELIALARIVARYGGLYASHQRSEGDEVLESIAEALRIGREAGLPVHLSHMKASGRPNWGRSAAILAALREARAAGMAVTGDQYAYDASSTSLDVLFPAEPLAIGRQEFAAKLRDDAAFRSEMHQALRRKMTSSGFGHLGWCRIASAPGHPELNGLTLDQAAPRLCEGRADADAQAEAAIALFIAAAGGRVGMVYHGMAEADVRAFLQEDWIAVASDAGLRDPTSPDRPHPRGSGNNPRVLGRYVREQRVLSLELAIHKMTALPCAIFGIADRGTIRPGAFADLVVFDPATILDRATWHEPTLPPVGIDHVLVNGVAVVDAGVLTGARAGMVLRGPAKPPAVSAAHAAPMPAPHPSNASVPVRRPFRQSASLPPFPPRDALPRAD